MEPLTFQPKPPSSSAPEANTKTWPRTSGTRSTSRFAACAAGLWAAGLSAARLIVALTSRPAAATAVRRGSVRIRRDTPRASERWNTSSTPLTGEVDDIGGERGGGGGRG